MMSSDCQTMRLAEFVDDELHGAERLAVARHVPSCSLCSSEVEALRGIGEALRATPATDVTGDLGGLASGVIARIRAERSISWRAMLDRAVDGWHWMLVGGGSLTAAAATTIFLSALIQFGPAPGRDDSMAALLTRQPWVLNSSEGALYITSKPAEGAASTADLASVYSNLIAPDGRVRDPGAMSSGDLKLADDLVRQIKKMDEPRPAFGKKPVAIATDIHIRFVTATDVSAKGL
jgi:hypothetical protein